MTNVALARQVYAPRVPAQPGTGAIAAVAGGVGMPTNQVTSTLSAITTYVPTEILTLYVAARSALTQTDKDATGAIQNISAAGLNPSEWVTFAAAGALTPVVVWLVYAAKLRAASKPLPLRPQTWPVWEMFAATIAFVVWAFAMPNSPFSYYKDWYSPAIAGLAVLVISTILGLVAPIFGPSR
jgi:hypothetical protein